MAAKPVSKDNTPVLDRQTALNQLYLPSHQPGESFDGAYTVQEEDRHPWRVQPSQSFHGPLLRVWDAEAGSKPWWDNRMVARAPEMRLDGYNVRQTSLAGHLDCQNWTPSPYISFTSSKATAESIARERTANPYRSAQFLTIIDPNTRLRNGLPILHVSPEMRHYGIGDPYNKNYEFYEDEYVCLWQVTDAEIIGHWKWTLLEQDSNWYENIILPAYNRFTERTARQQRRAAGRAETRRTEKT